MIKEFIANLTKEDLEIINNEFIKKNNKIPSFQFGKIRFRDLKQIVDINKKIKPEKKFDTWFGYKHSFEKNEIDFFEKLIDRNSFLIDSYKEEDLKIHFISPILTKVDFLLIDKEVRDFYEEPITYETDRFILTGITDFLVSKGLEYAQKPYFFIQEFKKSIKNDDPRPQLLAELISAVELNQWKSIKGAYIVGSIWNFVILEKIEKDKYQYFTSSNFDATKIDDLKSIYKNLLFIKDEISNDKIGGE
jgi:hypothetical protein